MTLKDSSNTTVVLWSTQSGRAKSCAKRCIRILKSKSSKLLKEPLQINGKCTFDEYGAERFLLSFQQQQQPTLLVLFVSTTGDAEHTDSITQTWAKLLDRRLPADLYQNVSLALFCLGDRSYGEAAFCAAGRKLGARMMQLGAKLLCDIGFGDDCTVGGGVFRDLDDWLNDLLLPSYYYYLSPVNAAGQRSSNFNVKSIEEFQRMSEPVSFPELCYRVNFLQNCGQKCHETEYDNFCSQLAPPSAYPFGVSSQKQNNMPLHAHVVENKRLTSDSWWQDVRHISMNVALPKDQIRDDKFYYRAGDIAVVLPRNSSASVDYFIRVLPNNIKNIVDQPIRIDRLNSDSTLWPIECTLRGLLTTCADINGRPERELLRALSAFVDRDHPHGRDQAEKLIQLSETTGSALYTDYIIREKRCFADVLYDFDAIAGSESTNKLTVEHLLELLPTIIPRHFSIASSPYLSRSKDFVYEKKGLFLELCVAVVKETTPLGRKHLGLCSNYLGCKVPSTDHSSRLWVRPGSFQELPLNIRQVANFGIFERPVLCIGAGTGIAPLRGIIEERHHRMLSYMKQNEAVVDQPLTTLVFGCRKETEDFLYNDEWKVGVNNRILEVKTAFSQDQKEKVYIQSILEKESSFIITHLIEKGGAIYIAGGAKMAKSVRDELIEILGSAMEEEGGEAAAKLFLKKLQRKGLFRIEAWN